MNDFETLIYEKRDTIAYITLNRPRVLNVYNRAMRDEFHQVLRAISDDAEVMAVILQGAGEKAFCAGADLKDFLTAASPTKAREALGERNIWLEFLSLPQPLIAALHGYVLGSGIEIALFCDIRIAADDAQFGLPEAGLGIIPGAGGTQNLPRATSRGSALDLILTGRWIGAWEAFHLGLVNHVVPKRELIPSVERIARRITAIDPLAVRMVKQALWRGSDLPLAKGLEMEKGLAQHYLTHR